MSASEAALQQESFRGSFAARGELCSEAPEQLQGSFGPAEVSEAYSQFWMSSLQLCSFEAS